MTTDDGRSGFFLTAKEDINKGEEIMLRYGKSKANGDFLRTYGFVLPSQNEMLSKVNLRVSLKELSEDPLRKAKNRVTDNETSLEMRIEEDFTSELMLKMLSFLRIVEFNDEDESILLDRKESYIQTKQVEPFSI